MNYADYTFKDKNILKRYLQQKRLDVAIKSSFINKETKQIIDVGAGNGELCKRIHKLHPKLDIICYEPNQSMLSQAKENLEGTKIKLENNINNIGEASVDIVFCLEVFEHLPMKETKKLIENIKKITKSDGKIVIGVPVELGIPALYKGIFRRSRRKGTFDTKLENIGRSVFYKRLEEERPATKLNEEMSYYHYHMGFDYRLLRKELEKNFKLFKIKTSPFSIFGSLLNPEINYILNHKGNDL